MQLSVSNSGHLVLPLILDSHATSGHVPNAIVRYPSSEGGKLDLADVLKIHKQLGRANLRQLSRALRKAGYDVAKQDIVRMLDKCGCSSSRARSHASAANAHMAPYPGYAVFVDIIYLLKTGRKGPYVMIIDYFQ